MAIAINFVAINANSLNRDASISVGANNQAGWGTHGKAIFGDSQVMGIGFTKNILNILIDTDLVDAPIIDNDIVPSAQNQTA